MNLTMLRAYAVQIEEVDKLELAELAGILQRTVEHMRTLESLARTDADRYLLQVQRGGTIDQMYGHLDAMDQAIATRKGMEQARGAQQAEWEKKREELLEAVQYRKKLDLLNARAAQELRRRQERQDQQLLDERAWRIGPLNRRERA